MAQTYITVDDLTNNKIKTFPTDILQKYVDRGNAWYEDFAKSKGLEIDEIAYPAPQICQDLIISKVQKDFAQDRIGGTSSNNSPQSDLYVMIYGAESKDYNDLVVRVTREIIEGDINRYSSTTIFGNKRGAYGRRWNEEGDTFCGR